MTILPNRKIVSAVRHCCIATLDAVLIECPLQNCSVSKDITLWRREKGGVHNPRRKIGHSLSPDKGDWQTSNDMVIVCDRLEKFPMDRRLIGHFPPNAL